MAEDDLPGVVKGGALMGIGAILGAGAVYFALQPPAPDPQPPSATEHNHAMHTADRADHTATHAEAWDHPEGTPAPSVTFTLDADPHGGWNLQIVTTNFRFAPDAVNGEAVPGEGHGHLYANGDKLARLYGPAYHVGHLPKGAVEIAVSLNTNDHRAIAVAGVPVTARQIVTIE